MFTTRPESKPFINTAKCHDKDNYVYVTLPYSMCCAIMLECKAFLWHTNRFNFSSLNCLCTFDTPIMSCVTLFHYECCPLEKQCVHVDGISFTNCIFICLQRVSLLFYFIFLMLCFCLEMWRSPHWWRRDFKWYLCDDDDDVWMNY